MLAAFRLLFVAVLIAPMAVWAHQDRPGCSATGGSITIETFRADRATALSVATGVTECETISYRATLAKPPQDTVCAFEQGSLTIQTPDGVVHDLTPRGTGGQSLIPCLGGTLQDPQLTPPAGDCDPSVFEFDSGFVDYQVRPQDVAAGSVVAIARYSGGLLHINPNNLANSANGSTAIRVRVTACPADTECRDNVCGPALSDGIRMGLCTFTDLVGEACRPAAGVCDVPEECVAGSPVCPDDVVAPPGTVCRPGSGDLCDPEEVCDGEGVSCPPDVVRPPTLVCREGAGDVCDPAETCPGTPGGTCPADVIQPPTFVCRAGSSDACDPDETCAGTSGGVCPPDAIQPPSFTCRPAVDACDRGEVCPGIARQACPPDEGQPLDTACEADADECTIDHCDGEGECMFLEDSTAPECAVEECGAGVTAPCQVLVDFPPQIYDDLQRAVDAANDGATLRVSGRCTGPVEIFGRRNLKIEGQPLSSERAFLCAGDNRGPGPGDLVSTLELGGTFVRGTGDEILKVQKSRGIIIRNLNIVDGSGACVELKRSAKNLVDCNCIARCTEGVEVHTSLGGDVVSHNLVEGHAADGILLRVGTVGATIFSNTVGQNAVDGIEVDDSDSNLIENNLVVDNAAGSGIPVRSSDDNVIDGNAIVGNGDGLSDVIDCRGGSKGNTGSNVPPTSRCR